MSNEKDFSYYISKYLTIYLKDTKGYSDNTIISYKQTFIQLLIFLKDVKRININCLKITNINDSIINEFVNWLESMKQISISSRNQKLSAIKSFFNYLITQNPEYYSISSAINNIPLKKNNNETINYLSISDISQILTIPKIDNIKECRELAIMTLLYDSGARIQEILDLMVNDINFGEVTTVRLFGKGKKYRIVPISKECSNIVKIYSDKYKLKNDNILFFNSRNEKLTRVGVTYILNKYLEKAREIYKIEYQKKITPHVFRHSKAMHLLEKGVNQIYIRDFLGHSSVVTTEIYAKANPIIKQQKIEEASRNIIEDTKYNNEEKENLIDWLKNIM